MKNAVVAVLLLALVCLAPAFAANKVHTVVLGKAMNVKLFVGATEDKPIDLKVRSLMVDGKLKEFTTGEPHDVTEHIFVVQRAYRVNDSLPEDPRTLPKWKWQRGGWLMVDRTTGRVSKVNLPDFDAFYSATSWYREFAAYCGTSPDGSKLFAVVAQIGVRRPIVHQTLGATSNGNQPDSECDIPQWQRQPTRVTFLPKHAPKVSFEIHGRSVDVTPGEEPEE